MRPRHKKIFNVRALKKCPKNIQTHTLATKKTTLSTTEKLEANNYVSNWHFTYDHPFYLFPFYLFYLIKWLLFNRHVHEIDL